MYESLGDVSLDLLRTFEAAARHRSFTAAALELGTTQPAISQQLKRLELHLGIRLFDRIYRGIALTEAGLGLFLHVQSGLQQINTGLQALIEQPAREVLQVATDFAFAAYWLMPRLARFHAAYPQIDVSLVTRERSHDTLHGDSDVAVLFGQGRFIQGDAQWLFNEEVFPVCSPRLLADQALPLSARVLGDFPLLQLRGEHARQWFDWYRLFDALKLGPPPAPGPLRFDNYTLLIQAAIAGQGMAIGWKHLVDNLLDQGVLCRPFAESAASAFGYYVVQPPRKRRNQLARVFVDWMLAEQNAHAGA